MRAAARRRTVGLAPAAFLGLGLAAILLLTRAAHAQDSGQSSSATDKSDYSLFDPTPDDDLRPFTTDRPTKSNVPFTVDAGHFQYETDLFEYTHSYVDGVASRLYTVADPVLKLGLTNQIDLELRFDGYDWLDTDGRNAAAAVQPEQGPADVTLRLKVNLFGNAGGPAMALIPYVTLPTTAGPLLDSPHTEGGVIAPISLPLPWSFTLLVMPEVDVLTNAANAGHHFNFTQLINLSHPLGSAVTVYGELYSALGTDPQTPPVYTVDAALAYTITKSLQLDVGVNVGLNRNASNLQLYSGLSQRF